MPLVERRFSAPSTFASVANPKSCYSGTYGANRRFSMVNEEVMQPRRFSMPFSFADLDRCALDSFDLHHQFPMTKEETTQPRRFSIAEESQSIPPTPPVPLVMSQEMAQI